jgi:hypothetical protein
LTAGTWIISYSWLKYSNFYEDIQDEEAYEVTSDGYGKGAPKYSRISVN